MKKIAFVVQRYAENINGGAEYHCRMLAEHMAAKYEVEVLTSTALDYNPWDDYFYACKTEINGVTVRSFRVEMIRDEVKFATLSDRMKRGDADASDEWIDQMGPYCPSFVEYIRDNYRNYAAIIFFTYSYYLTVRGLGLELPNAILLPTAHDEPNSNMPIYKEMFRKPVAYLYNSIEERELLETRFGTTGIPSRTGCAGIVVPSDKREFMPERFKEYIGNYVCYVGRVSIGKNYKELNRFFIEYKKRNPSNLKLIVIGKIDEGMKLFNSKDIIYTGFISEDEKAAIMQNAEVLINPSKFESLSLVMLESMACNRPVLVNGRCEVLKGQCIRSNAGLYYMNYFEFEEALNYILGDNESYEQMCENGMSFVKENYSWEHIVDNVSSLIEEISG